MSHLTYSIAILTYNRRHLVPPLLRDLEKFAQAGSQVIVVDNCSELPVAHVVQDFPWALVIRADHNLGAAGRNLALAAASGEVVICLDDDVSGLTPDAVERLDDLFRDPQIGAVNFKVLEEQTNRIVNWVHHRASEIYSDVDFETYEITEGAVALRRRAIEVVGGYPESFFLSHEGPDLAYRLMNSGWRVTYTPTVSVVHSFAAEGRASWRNYYFDTRNAIWLALRNLPLWYGLRLVARQTGAMLIYALRDGYVSWWVKGVADGLRGMRIEVTQRECISPATLRRLKAIDRQRPSVWYVVKRRLMKRGFKL